MHKYQSSFRRASVVKLYNNTGRKHVAVVGGGMSAEREVSLSSSKSVIASLINLRYQVSFIDMGADIASVLIDLKPDVVYNALHGTYGEDGCLPGLLNIMRIPYTHSGVLASAIAFCKLKSNALFKANNVTTIPQIIVSKEQNIKNDPMSRPYVIKPISQGSSIGVELIFNEDNFDFGTYDFPYGDQIIVEKYIKGRELQVAILDGKALGCLEIKLLKSRFYDYQTKYTDGFAEHICPADLADSLYLDILRESEKIYDIIGCKSIARAEFLYEENEKKLYILEINTHPGMTNLSICPEIALHVGINFNELVERILLSASYEK
jgi:D-alanine-D-alanine ligase